MRAEKASLCNEIRDRLKASPFVILADYTGLTVQDFTELRGRLSKTQSRALVVKNSFLKVVMKELKLPELNGALQGPTAVIYGEKDFAAAASVVKGFHKEFKKPRIKAGILDQALLKAEDVNAIADLPPRPVLQAQLLGLLMSPANTLVRLFNTPASQMVQVLKAKSEKGGGN
jgi:large subunit ribosomal protein L10